ncbi:MAG: branched-chain amino acid ABC transporter permease [Pseudomonadota bacterium]
MTPAAAAAAGAGASRLAAWSRAVVGEWLNLQLVLSLAIVALAAAAGWFVDSTYYIQIMTLTAIYAALGVAWVIAGGLGGLLLLGYISFFGLGAYVNGVLLSKFGVSPWASLAVGAAAAGLLALMIAAVSLRFGLNEDYFAMFTVALSQVLKLVFLNWDYVGRATGIYITVIRDDFWAMAFLDRRPYLYIALALLAIVVAVNYAIQRSRLGYYLAAVRENADAAEALGIDVSRIKAVAMTISGALAGTIGAFYCQFATFIEPKQVFSLATNFEMLLAPVIGGRLSLIGPILGASAIKPIQDLLRGWLGGGADAYYLIIYGVVLVGGILLMPRGMASYLEAWHRRRFAEPAPGRPSS